MRILLSVIATLFLFAPLEDSLAQGTPNGWGVRPKHSLPPLGSDDELLPAQIIHVGTGQPQQAAPQKSQPAPTTVVPPEDKPDIADEVDDSETEAAVEPHVEEDSAGGLVDMGDVGGDFEE